MGRKQIAAMSVVGMLLGTGSLLASSTGASATAEARRTRPHCEVNRDDRWPGWTSNRPENVDPKTADGVYMWHDTKGWHVRATHRSPARESFSGTITTSGRFFAVSSVRLEGHDWRRVSKDHRTITFRFENHGAIDGLNFRTYCASSMEFTFVGDGETMPADSIKIGAGGVTPDTNPFTITRTAPAPVSDN
jgi:hypothetical protein